MFYEYFARHESQFNTIQRSEGSHTSSVIYLLSFSLQNLGDVVVSDEVTEVPSGHAVLSDDVRELYVFFASALYRVLKLFMVAGHPGAYRTSWNFTTGRTRGPK